MPPAPLPADRSARSRLRPVALFVLGLALVDVPVVAFRDTWDRHSPDDYAERVAGCRAAPRDVVFVGGSPVSEGLDPAAVAGVTWRGRPLASGYAVGLRGGTTSDVLHALRHGCPTPPRVVVYGITASDLNDSRHEPHGPYSLMTWGDWAEWVRTRPGAREWVTRHFLGGQLRKCWAVFRYRHGVRMWAAATAYGVVPGCCQEAAAEARAGLTYSAALRAGNGYAPDSNFVDRRYDQAKAAGWVAPPFTYLHKYKTGSHLGYLHKIADWAAGHGAELVLLDMPVTPDLERDRHPEAFAEYRRRLAEFEAGRPDVRIVRASRDAVGLDDSHFADLIHLNAAGAGKLSGWVRDRLAEIGGGRP